MTLVTVKAQGGPSQGLGWFNYTADDGAAYASARDGVGSSLVEMTYEGPLVGQEYSSGTHIYSCRQCHLYFDLSTIHPAAVLDSLTLRIGAEDAYSGAAWVLEAYLYNYGVTAGPNSLYGASDFIPGALIANYERMAYITVNSWAADTAYDMTTEAALLTYLKYPSDRAAFCAAWGTSLRLVLVSANQRTNTPPSGAEYIRLDTHKIPYVPIYDVFLDAVYTNYQVEALPELDMEVGHHSNPMLLAPELELEPRMKMRVYGRSTSRWIRLFDHERALVGILDADADYSAVLDGSDTISVNPPYIYTLDDGTSDDRSEMIRDATYAEYGRHYYRIQDDTQRPHDNSFPIEAVSAEVDLEDFLTNYNGVPFSMPSHTPTEIFDALFSGQIESDWYNGDFSQLDAEGFPVGWTETTGEWTPKTTGGTAVTATTFPGGAALLEAIGASLVSGSEIKPMVEFMPSAEFAGVVTLTLSWQNLAGVESSVDELEMPYTPGAWTYYEAPEWLPIRNDQCVLKLSVTNNTDADPVTFRSVRFRQDEDDTGWSYQGTMDTRDPEVPYNDPAIQLFGAWIVDTVNSVVYSSEAGAVLGRVFTGDAITVNFAAGGAGAKADILVDGEAVVAGLSVETTTSYGVSDLNRYRSHIIEVIVDAGTVSVSGLTLSSENRIAVSWNKATVYDAAYEAKDIIGGEYEWDTVTRTLYHDVARGDDLTASNVLWLREGANIGRLEVQTARTVKNRLYMGGYGDGAFQIGVRVDDPDSQATYGTRRKAETDKEIKDRASLAAKALTMLAASKAPPTSYTTTVADDIAALISPGDTVRVTADCIGTLTLRVLEVSRHTDGSEGSLTFGVRPIITDAAAQNEQMRRQVSKLLRA